MKPFEIEAKIGKEGTPQKISLDMGETLAELTEQYGEDVIFNHARSSIVVAAQGKMRNLMDEERDGGPLVGDALQNEMNKWKPGIRKPGKPASEKVKEAFAKMDPELRKQLLAELAAGGTDEQELEEQAEADETAEEEEEEQAPAPNTRRGRR